MIFVVQKSPVEVFAIKRFLTNYPSALYFSLYTLYFILILRLYRLMVRTRPSKGEKRIRGALQDF